MTSLYEADLEIKDYDKLSDFVAIYHATVAIPNFKKAMI